jgi:hypothetical protein
MFGGVKLLSPIKVRKTGEIGTLLHPAPQSDEIENLQEGNEFGYLFYTTFSGATMGKMIKNRHRKPLYVMYIKMEKSGRSFLK